MGANVRPRRSSELPEAELQPPQPTVQQGHEKSET